MKGFIIALLGLVLPCLCCNATEATPQASPADTAAVARAPRKAPQRFYMEIVGLQSASNPNAIKVTIDMGRILPDRLGVSDAEIRKAVSDMRFTSMVDAMNAFSLLGWQLADAYVFQQGHNVVHHWVLTKDVTDLKQLVIGLVPQKK